MRRLAHSRRRGYGFTLIELLVVVAIIALLTSILLPSLKRAQDLAKEIACASNIRQIGIAAHEYITENNGFLPPLRTDISVNDWLQPIWQPAVLRPYLQSYAVFNCPARDGKYHIDDATGVNAFGWRLGNYAINGRLSGLKADDALDGFHFASSQVLYADGNAAFWNLASISLYLTAVHSDRVNVLFPDCHVGAADPTEIQSYSRWPDVPSNVLYVEQQ